MSLLYLCTAWNISLFRWYENDLFPCNNKSILMLTLLFFGVDIYIYVCVCLESNKTNRMLLYFGQINKKWLLSSNGPLQFGQSVTAIGRVWIKWGKGGEFRQILKKIFFHLLSKVTLAISKVRHLPHLPPLRYSHVSIIR